jgi:UDP-GlcNAc:undecaprenyl-phosphate/decaprenyl-phosphate GlcNAc-1-phosphate transferase
MINSYLYIAVIILINLLIFINFQTIKNKINLIDDPKSEVRKIHKKPVSQIGGIWLMLNLFIIYFFSKNFFEIKIFNESIHDLKKFGSLWMGLLFLFLIGLVDDKFKIKTSIKSILLFFSIVFVLLIDKYLILNTVNLSFLDKSFSIGSLSFFFTLLSILLFINATNLYDGIDLQLGFYSLFLISYFIFIKLSFYFFLPIFIFIIFYLILNYKKLLFFGDNGSYVIGFLFGYLFIKSYNYEVIDYADKIFLIMILPGLDMLRLFIIRILSKKNPFYPDQNHIHHLLLNHKKNNIIQVNLVTIFLAVSPLIISQLFNSNILGLSFFLTLYGSIIYFKKN